MSVLKIALNDEDRDLVKDTSVSAMSPAKFPPSPVEMFIEQKLPSSTSLSLRDFAITQCVGRGSYGTVLLVKHIPTGTCGALKVTRKYLAGKDEASSVSPSEALQTGLRFFITLQEQRALRRVTGTPGMLDMLASFHDTKNFYVFSTYYPGGDLERRLNKLGRFSDQDTRFYAAELILALQTLRNLGVIHRDIKPANILIDADGHLALADFGLARTFDDYDGLADYDANPFPLPRLSSDDSLASRHNTNMRCGTIEYMAPEIVVGANYSHAADMWSVGVTVFQMLVGRLPWDLDDYKEDFEEAVLELPPTITEEEVEDLSLDVMAVDLVYCMLEKTAEYRSNPTSLKEHPFFDTIDWKKLAQRQIPVPWIPSIEDNNESRAGKIPTIVEGSPIQPDEDPFPKFTFMSSLMVVPPAPPSPVLDCLDAPGTPYSDGSTLAPDTPPSLADDKALPPADTPDAAAIFSICSSVSEFSSIASQISDLDMLDLISDFSPLPEQCVDVSEPLGLISKASSQVLSLSDLDGPDPADIPCPPSASSVVSQHPVPRGSEPECPLTFASPDQDLELGLVGEDDSEESPKLSIFGRLKSWAVGLFSRAKKAWSLWGSASLTF